MEAKFVDYFNAIDLSDTIKDVVINKYNLLRTFTGIDKFDDIIITENKSSGGDKQYFELYCFAENYFCLSAITKTVMGVYKLKKHISNITSDELNFDLITSDEASRFEVGFRRQDSEHSFSLYTTGKNCPFLVDIIKKHLLPNLL
jgi:hypothetical protein